MWHILRNEKKIVHYKYIIFNTPPQGGAYMSYAPSLLQMYLILGSLRDLVKMSASWSFVLTTLVATHPDAIFSLMKWQSTSICLVLSWKIGLDAICNVVWLSQTSFIYSYFPNLNSWRSCLNHMSSHVAKAITRYSASALDQIGRASCRERV